MYYSSLRTPRTHYLLKVLLTFRRDLACNVTQCLIGAIRNQYKKVGKSISNCVGQYKFSNFRNQDDDGVNFFSNNQYEWLTITITFILCSNTIQIFVYYHIYSRSFQVNYADSEIILVYEYIHLDYSCKMEKIKLQMTGMCDMTQNSTREVLSLQCNDIHIKN